MNDDHTCGGDSGMANLFAGRRRATSTLIVIVLSLGLLTAAAGLFGQSPVQAAQSLDELERALREQEDRLEDIEQSIRNKQAGLRQAQADRRDLQETINNLEAQIDVFEGKIYELQAELDELDGQISVKEDELAQAEDELAQRIDLAGRRVRALHEDGAVSILEVLVASRSFTDFLTRFSYLQQMLKQDVQLLYEVQDEKARIELAKANLEADREKVAALRAAASQQLAHIASIRDGKLQALVDTEEDIAEIERQLDELAELSTQIEKKLQEAEKAYLAELERRGISFTGLRWPLPRGGWISSPYGPRFHPILKTWKMHTGVDIAISKGTPIYAAAGGKVIMAGWYGGYGKVVMIAHGKGTDGKSYVTLYAHASVVRVKVNEWVVSGQHIADVGSTGYSTGPHLHFEVRINGKTVDPMDLVSKP